MARDGSQVSAGTVAAAPPPRAPRPTRAPAPLPQDFSAPSATTPASDAGAAASQDPRFPTIAAHGADSGPGLPSASDSQPRAAPSDDLQSSGPPKLPHLSSLMPPLSFSGQASPITPAPLPPFPVPPSMAPVGHSGPDPWAMGVPGIASPSPSTRTREATSRTAALLGRRRPTAEITEEELSRVRRGAIR